jgi:hypothetical protein
MYVERNFTFAHTLCICVFHLVFKIHSDFPKQF